MHFHNLAEIVPQRLKLESTLASAEANLNRAVLELASGLGDRSAASDFVDKARAAQTRLDRARS